MDTRYAQRIEGILSFGAAAIFAAAVAYAVCRLTSSMATVAAAGAAALFIALQILRSISPSDRGFSLTQFAPAEMALEESNELLLTEADRFNGGHSSDANDELVLDDVLAKSGEESRVVRMFDPSAMPTPGQLKARIDRHLNQTPAQGASPDASGALHEALAELRRSLK
jgi:hypothetical protein